MRSVSAADSELFCVTAGGSGGLDLSCAVCDSLPVLLKGVKAAPVIPGRLLPSMALFHPNWKNYSRFHPFTHSVGHNLVLLTGGTNLNGEVKAVFRQIVHFSNFAFHK